MNRTIDRFPYFAFLAKNTWKLLFLVLLYFTYLLTILSTPSAYKKGHSTEVLLVKMNEDQRRALDKNLTVRIVFIHFRQEFDSISHDFLLDKVQTILVFYALSG